MTGLASALVLLVSVSGYALVNHYVGQIKTIDAFAGLNDRPAASAHDAMNILLVGSDDRSDLTRAQQDALHTGDESGERSDTMMLIHIAKDRGTVTVVSLPRDSLVSIPPYTDSRGVHHAAHRDKLNAAYSEGGAPLTIATIEKATNVRIDHYVEVDFAGFVNVVDALGGVNICLPQAVNDPKSGLDLSAGTHHVDGIVGLEYSRARYTIGDGSDLGRIQRQHAFIAAMIKQATTSGVLFNPLKLNDVLGAALKSVKTDNTFTKSSILDLANELRSIPASHITFTTVPLANADAHYNGASVVTWDQSAANSLFAQLRTDNTVTAPKAIAKPTIPPGVITLRVVNGTQQNGLATQAADDLSGLGFGIAGPATNANVAGATATIVTYDPRWSTSLLTVLASIPGAMAKPVVGQGKVFVVTVGSSYKGVVKPVLTKAPKTTTTSTSHGSSNTTTAATNACAAD